jgi:anthranilate synthase/aminodeoxychorismate synthase-like glutamine amidotransferase
VREKMNVLIVDNIDSFVYNIVQYVGMLGAEPVVVQNTENFSGVEKIVEEKEIEHIIISPGPKTPKEAGISNDVIRGFCNKKILGVCLGHQCIGYVFGARIKNAKELRHGKLSLVEHNGRNILKGLKCPLPVVRYHSLVIDDGNGKGTSSLPDCLEVTARSLDDNEIMAIRHKDRDIFGVQFHPESILTEEGIKILKNFLEI